ncbi:sigma-70 family RNA polymerase sigma factor [Heyndrickxia acidicola]|uniref:Sigma-70 family RNA polymerase sigma factor n=1 Tax=Heyndrickxia acidicola TaxID=209389 RepID=A0ABU6ML48_9BACI|nr:sigma-70 family RNA polymerase sigma factor [Heyndrickxia acidicola]MED1205250.1 sigma-70 family RNA polymerase sigma factor [Heyndrickxia acidicola]
MDEVSLVEKAKKGDETAFYQAMLLHKEQLYRIAISYLKTEEGAIEAIQEITYRCYKSLKKLKKAEYFSTWLIRILLNYCHDELRKQKRIVLSSEMAELAGAKEDTSFIELYEAVEALHPKYRDVIMLKYYHDLKIADIARILECPEGTIKTWLKKGLQLIRKQWTEEGGDTIA